MMTRRTKRLWTDVEKRSICLQTTAPSVSVAQVARRYAANANMIFKWLRDPRYTPEAGLGAPAIAPDAGGFPPAEILDRPRHEDPARATDPGPATGSIEIGVAGGRRLRISGAYDPDALARLIRGSSA
jgi:transposase